MFERKYTTESEKVFETGRKKDIGVKIEAAEAVDRQVPEEIVALDSFGE
jgi:hypothetical protein